jgi:hypothetical protein
MMFRPGKRPWAAISPALKKLGYDYGIAPEASALPDGFAAKRAHEAQAVTGLSEIFEVPSTATFWFDRVSPSSPRNCVIVEQAVRLSQFGVLALLLFPKLP